VALPDSLHVVPLLSVLPSDVAHLYSQPDSGLLRTTMDRLALDLTQPLQPPRVAGSRREYVKLIHRLKGQGMISFTNQPKAVNGVFTVEKDDQSDRLIIDAQPANRCFIDSPHVQLPDPSHLVQLQLPKGKQLYVSKTDLSNFYHHLGLPNWIQPYFALPALSPEELIEIGVEDISSPFPMCLTLPMGFSHAVFLAQSGHENILYRGGVLNREDNLLQLSSPSMRMDRAHHGIYIDDFFLFCMSRSLAMEIHNRVILAYGQAGFIVKRSKVVEPTTSPVKVIGMEVCGSQATVGLSTESMMSLLSSTLHVLSSDVISGYHLSQLIGCWTWCLLVRRPALSVLQHTYRFIQVAQRKRFTLWNSVKRELWMLIGLLPLMEACLHSPFFQRVVATDASQLGAGIVTTQLSSIIKESVWQLCSTPKHAVLQTMVNGNKNSSIVGTDLELLSQSQDWYDRFYRLISGSAWSTIMSKGWSHVEHINVLELRVVLLSLHWILSYPSSISSRVITLVDSTVTFFSLWKGRSSSPQLLFVIRKISSLLLAGDISLLLGWLPSEWNPADSPSRLIERSKSVQCQSR